MLNKKQLQADFLNTFPRGDGGYLRIPSGKPWAKEINKLNFIVSQQYIYFNQRWEKLIKLFEEFLASMESEDNQGEIGEAERYCIMWCKKMIDIFKFGLELQPEIDAMIINKNISPEAGIRNAVKPDNLNDNLISESKIIHGYKLLYEAVKIFTRMVHRAQWDLDYLQFLKDEKTVVENDSNVKNHPKYTEFLLSKDKDRGLAENLDEYNELILEWGVVYNSNKEASND